MNRNLKIALIILAIVLILCLCLCAGGLLFFQIAGRSMSGAVSSDPTQAAQVAGDIANFEVPPGFEQGSLEFLGFQVVFLDGTGSQSSTMILLMQFPQAMAVSPEQMRQQMELFANRQAGPLGLDLALVGETEVQIKGEPVTFSILEGESDDGSEYRQWAGVIDGRGGPAYLSITAPVSDWDQALIDKFLASIE
jgi:hypothetical protein